MLFRHISKSRNCPECQSAEVFRVKRTGVALKIVCNVMNVRPHWCASCDTFFLAPKQEKERRVNGEQFEVKTEVTPTGRAGHSRLAH